MIISAAILDSKYADYFLRGSWQVKNLSASFPFGLLCVRYAEKINLISISGNIL